MVKVTNSYSRFRAIVLSLLSIIIYAPIAQTDVDNDQVLEFYWSKPQTGVVDHYNVYVYKLLFNVGLECITDLNNRKVPLSIQQKLSLQNPAVSIVEASIEWFIIDGLNKYNVKKDVSRLNVYSYIDVNDQATETPTVTAPYKWSRNGIINNAVHESTYEFQVAAADANNNEGTKSERSDPVLCYLSSQPVSIKLSVGHNFISLPVQPSDASLSEVLATIKKNGIYVLDCTTNITYKAKQLNSMYVGHAYYINMASSAELVIRSWQIVPLTQNIKPVMGVCFFGYNSLQSMPVSKSLTSILTNNGYQYSEAYYYDASTKSFVQYNPAAGAEISRWGMFIANITKTPVASPPLKNEDSPVMNLLAQNIPEVNLLRQNFPNPFNPETWIPYQLKEDADVVINIYSPTGQLIRKLDIGNRTAGFYTNRDRAAYWDGKNNAGEDVSSGVYFYSISAGDFVSTRKMIIIR